MYVAKYSLLLMQLDDVLYEIDAKSENWMIAGRKRGHVSLSPNQGLFTFFITQENVGG